MHQTVCLKYFVMNRFMNQIKGNGIITRKHGRLSIDHTLLALMQREINLKISGCFFIFVRIYVFRFILSSPFIYIYHIYNGHI